MPKILYRSKNFHLEEDIVPIKGHKFTFARIVNKRVVVIIPIINGRLLMEKQTRAVVKNKLIEFPAGHVENNEDIATAANRELEEETGYTAKNIYFLFSGYVAPGISTQRNYYFIATNLKKTKRSLDEDEQIDIIKKPLNYVYKMLMNNKINDNNTIIGILYLMNRFNGKLPKKL